MRHLYLVQSEDLATNILPSVDLVATSPEHGPWTAKTNGCGLAWPALEAGSHSVDFFLRGTLVGHRDWVLSDPPTAPIRVGLDTYVPAPTTGDMLSLNAAKIVNAPDVTGWKMGAAVTHVSFDGATSRIAFTKQDGADRWPDVRPPNFQEGDSVQYTWWLFREVNGQFVGSAFVEMWHGRDGSGRADDPDVPSLYHAHWSYDQRWSPLNTLGPIKPGERIGMMVTSGDARDSKGPYSVQERSNIVTFAAADVGTFTF